MHLLAGHEYEKVLLRNEVRDGSAQETGCVQPITAVGVQEFDPADVREVRGFDFPGPVFFEDGFRKGNPVKEGVPVQDNQFLRTVVPDAGKAGTDNLRRLGLPLKPEGEDSLVLVFFPGRKVLNISGSRQIMLPHERGEDAPEGSTAALPVFSFSVPNRIQEMAFHQEPEAGPADRSRFFLHIFAKIRNFTH